ncbi:MAG: TGS domain-containing protein [Anaerolineae bacterium]|nr:TGS domain-containing protein [Anaerolineae bacterium]
MPTNLPPEYFAVEKEYKAATTTEDKIRLLEELIATVPKHKGTDHLRADMRRRLSKLKSAAQTKKSGGKRDTAYHIDREGAGQVAVIGPANVGKSALVVALTNATPEVAPYPFTTWAPTPGMMEVGYVPIQLIDTPPLNADFVEPELLNLIRRADLLLIVVDLQTFPTQHLEETLAILERARIAPLLRQDLYEDERRLMFKPVLVVANKCDGLEMEEDVAVLREMLDEPWPLVAVSAATGYNLAALKEAVYDDLDLIRVYSKPPGQAPNHTAPFVLDKGSTVEEFAARVHKDFVTNLKSARVWGSGVHDGQSVGRDHVLQEGDIVELRT